MPQTLQATARINDAATSTINRMISATDRLIHNFESLDRGSRRLGGNSGARQMQEEILRANQRALRMERTIQSSNARIRDMSSEFSRVSSTVATLENRLNSANRDIIEMSTRIAYLERGMGNVERSTGGAGSQQRVFNDNLAKGAGSMNRLVGLAKQLLAAYVTINGLKMFGQATDSYSSTKARLKLINDGLQSQEELQNKIMSATYRSRAEYDDFAASTAKMGLLAGDAFGSNSELIYFMETMQKAFKVSGASQSEASNAMYQLTQAMAAGRLQGDEFRSIMENAPMLADSIEKYMKEAGVEGTIRDWSSEGLLTADVIKKALFSAADDIEAKYSELPNTFSGAISQIGTIAKNTFGGVFTQVNGILNDVLGNDFGERAVGFFNGLAVRAMSFISLIRREAELSAPSIRSIADAFTPVIDRIFSVNGLAGTLITTIGRLARSQSAQKFFNTFASAANIAVSVITALIKGIGWVSQSFGGLAPVLAGIIVAMITFNTVNSIFTVTGSAVSGVVTTLNGIYNALQATVKGAAFAQMELNAAMKANPYLLVASAILSVVAALAAMLTAVKAVNNAAGIVGDSGLSVGGYTQAEREYAKAHGLTNSGAKSILDTMNEADENIAAERASIAYNNEQIARLKNSLNDVNSQYSQNIKNSDIAREQVEKQIATLEADNKKALENIAFYTSAKIEDTNAMAEQDRQAQAATKALNDIEINTPSIDDISGNVSDISGNTERIADSLDVTNEALQYLRDNAEREAVNRFTTAEIRVDMTNNNSITNASDFDGLITSFGIKLREELSAAAEGSYI